MRITRSMLGVALVMAIGAALLVGSVSDTTEAKKIKNPEVTFEFSVTYDRPQIATEIVALVLEAGNIGSSGEDGISGGSNFQVDSFFDIAYRVTSGDPDSGVPASNTIEIEIVALQLKSVDPVTVIDAVRRALSEKEKPKDFLGHVTVVR